MSARAASALPSDSSASAAPERRAAVRRLGLPSMARGSVRGVYVRKVGQPWEGDVRIIESIDGRGSSKAHMTIAAPRWRRPGRTSAPTRPSRRGPKHASEMPGLAACWGINPLGASRSPGKNMIDSRRRPDAPSASWPSPPLPCVASSRRRRPRFRRPPPAADPACVNPANTHELPARCWMD